MNLPNDYDKMITDYADSLLRGVSFHYFRILELILKLEEINHKLSGNPKSPKIISKEEAKYQKGTYIFKDNIVSLMTEEQEYIEELKEHEKALNVIGKKLYDRDKYNDEDIEILSLYYEKQYSIKLIAAMLNVTKTAVYNRINEILLKIGESE